MKSQVAAEAVAAVSMAREGWRPAQGALKLVFVSDEETGGDVGARWLCENHPDKVRCDMLINEGGGPVLEYDGTRYYGVCVAEKGIFRFRLTATGVAGHASLPKTGDNALLKLGPVLTKIGASEMPFEVTEGPAALLRGLGYDSDDPAAALRAIAETAPALLIFVEPMLGVTLTPTMIHASDKINVIPSRASLKVDCRVPPGLGEEAAMRRLDGRPRRRREHARRRVHRASRRQRLTGRHAADERDRPVGEGERLRCRVGAGDPPGVLGLAMVP